MSTHAGTEEDSGEGNVASIFLAPVVSMVAAFGDASVRSQRKSPHTKLLLLLVVLLIGGSGDGDDNTDTQDPNVVLLRQMFDERQMQRAREAVDARLVPLASLPLPPPGRRQLAAAAPPAEALPVVTQEPNSIEGIICAQFVDGCGYWLAVARCAPTLRPPPT